MTAITRRRRLPDGTFGKLEKVFGGETQDEKIARLEAENLMSLQAIAMLFEEMLTLKGGDA